MSTGRRTRSSGRPSNLSPLANTDSGLVSDESRTPFFRLKSGKEITALQDIVDYISKPITEKDLKDEGIVYVLKFEETDHVKVGYSSKTNLTRVGTIGYECGLNLRRMYQHIPLKGAYRAEQITHRLLSEVQYARLNCPCGTAKIKGHKEWFQKSFVETVGLVQLVCNWMQLQDPYNLEGERPGKLDGLWKEMIKTWMDTQKSLSPRHWSEFFLWRKSSMKPVLITPRKGANNEDDTVIWDPVSGMFDVSCTPKKSRGARSPYSTPQSMNVSTAAAGRTLTSANNRKTKPTYQSREEDEDNEYHEEEQEAEAEEQGEEEVVEDDRESQGRNSIDHDSISEDNDEDEDEEEAHHLTDINTSPSPSPTKTNPSTPVYGEKTNLFNPFSKTDTTTNTQVLSEIHLHDLHERISKLTVEVNALKKHVLHKKDQSDEESSTSSSAADSMGQHGEPVAYRAVYFPLYHLKTVAQRLTGPFFSW